MIPITEVTLFAGVMAAGSSDMLTGAERELQETKNKHQVLLKEYAAITAFGQRNTQSQGARVLQSLLHQTKQTLVQQKITFDMKSRSSAFLQYARNAKDNHKVLKQCLKEVNRLKVVKPKSSRKLCKDLGKKKAMLERTSEDTHYISELLEGLPLDDYDVDVEDEGLANDLATLKQELLDSLPPTPLSEVESPGSLHTDILNTPTNGGQCK